MPCDDLENGGRGRGKAQEQGNIYVVMTDSSGCMAETNTSL